MTNTVEILDIHKKNFDRVAPPGDWRGPINTLVTVGRKDIAGELNAILDSITHYTGISARYIDVENVNKTTFRIRCAGYRNGPCGP